MGEWEADRENEHKKKRKEQRSYLKGSELREMIPFVCVWLIAHIRAGSSFTLTNVHKGLFSEYIM